MNILGFFVEINVILIVTASILALLLILSLTAFIISIKANRKMKKLLNNSKGTDIVEKIREYYEKCKDIDDKFSDVERSIKKLEEESSVSIKKVGTLRYDAFDENNANLSFVAALLDESDNGFVLNGVYSRGNTATYLKSIRKGMSTFVLSDEEIKAIAIAKENYEAKKKEN